LPDWLVVRRLLNRHRADHPRLKARNTYKYAGNIHSIQRVDAPIFRHEKRRRVVSAEPE